MTRQLYLRSFGAAAVFATVIVSGVLISPLGKAADDESESKIQRGFALAPVPLNLAGKNRALVGMGSYLVNAVGGCNDCHTDPSCAPGHNLLARREDSESAAAAAGSDAHF